MEKLAFESADLNVKPKTLSTTGKVLLAATGGVAVGLSVICASFVAPAFRRFCLPYVPATEEQIRNVFACLPKNAKGRLLDIGSGDGRIVIAAAKQGFKADGVELNPWLVWFSRLSALRAGVNNNTRFYRRDLWKFNIKDYNYLVIFGVESMMKDLEHKLLTEADVNAKIIACRFPLPKSEAQHTIEEGVHTVWYYDLKKLKSI